MDPLTQAYVACMIIATGVYGAYIGKQKLTPLFVSRKSKKKPQKAVRQVKNTVKKGQNPFIVAIKSWAKELKGH